MTGWWFGVERGMAASVRVAVLGAGAMGSLVAARFALAGIDVLLLGRRSAHLAAVDVGGVRLEELDGTSRTVALDATADPAAVTGAGLLVVLVKAWATAEALAPLRAHLDPNALVLTLQNGLGNAAAIRSALGASRNKVLVGVTSQAALRREPGIVRHTGTGPTVIGRDGGGDDADVTTVVGLFERAGLPAAAVPDVAPWLWRKLAVNAAINGPTALAGVPNGAVVDDPALREAAAVLALEVAAVARARGLELGDVVAAVADVATRTAANRSSMLRDLETGGRTEVEAIYGALLAAGEAVGVDAPANRVVAALVRARERGGAGYEPRAEGDERG